MTANATAWWTPTMAGGGEPRASLRLLVALGLIGVRRGNGRRPLVGGRIRLRHLRRLRRIPLVGRRIRPGGALGPPVFWPGVGRSAGDASSGAWFVWCEHLGVLYRETGQANPLLRTGEPLGQLLLRALPLL